MEILERIAVAAVKQDRKKPCWYCEEDPGKRNNDLGPDPGDEGENDEVNCASKLGQNLGEAPGWSIQCPTTNKPVNIVPAAHHCIPGNASLKKAVDLHDFMKKGGVFNLSSDIGYSVNHGNNGVWLPGNYGVRAGKNSYTKNWGSQTNAFKVNYANRAMKGMGLQFHDSHPAYSKNVRQTLESIAAKLGEPDKTCPICGDDLKDGTRPPYGLVSRLDNVSGRHRNLITKVGKQTKKHVSKGYFTSSRVKTYLGI
jgi:hypothetical protein